MKAGPHQRLVNDDIHELVFTQEPQYPLAPVPFKPDSVSEFNRNGDALELLRAGENVGVAISTGDEPLRKLEEDRTELARDLQRLKR